MGRRELADIVTKATYDDVPIKPGETVILTAREMVANWERARRENGWPDTSKCRAEIQVLSFGDGTGYWATELYPPRLCLSSQNLRLGRVSTVTR